MKTYVNPKRSAWAGMCERPARDAGDLESIVAGIFDEVRSGGDLALVRMTKKFDKADIDSIELDRRRLEELADSTPPALKRAIDTAYDNIRRFHKAQAAGLPRIEVETVPGVRCWREPRAIGKVGLYIPGGSAPLFSTVLMLGVPARLAGCGQVVMCTPPGPDGAVDPAICYAALKTGIDKVFRVGGAQAVAAMACGTDTVPKVDKIFGPGNSYVTAAKQYASRFGTAIDMPAGPSEIMVIADSSARPDFVAADLLSQAEHGPDSQVVLVCTSESMAKAVKTELSAQLETLPRKAIAEQALSGSFCVIFGSVGEALQFADTYAPEHLVLSVKSPRKATVALRNAGSVFLGNYSPESAGDYASGTNHTLPTDGWARAYGGLSLESFYKYVTFQYITRDGARSLAPTVMTMAAAEGLEAHRRAMEIRL
jgi:histidinol dehydrogenase